VLQLRDLLLLKGRDVHDVRPQREEGGRARQAP
jgi:hypothetical protein